MRRLLLIALTWAGSALATYGQAIDFDHFTTLKSAGKVPEDFTTRASTKFKKDVTKVNSDSRREQKDMESFLLESNYQIEDMLFSGRVIFGDPITNYLNAIKDEILKNDKKLNESIRIYTLLSNEVNAFTFDNGIIVVTTGLVSQVQNEAQLAFILCHEIVHYTEKHSITSYVENRKVERGTGIYSSLSNDEADDVRFSYAKEQETEADEQGLEMYKKSNYSYAIINDVFDVLLYSYLPYDEIEFDMTMFNDSLYVIPAKMFSDSLNAITAEEDYDDSKSTHPNIRSRKSNINDEIPEDNTGRLEYIVSEAQFNEVQKLARFQACELYLVDTEYEQAIYQAYLLQQDNPGNLYLQKVITEALYGWAMYKSAESIPEDHINYRKIEGESQQVFYMFNKMPAKDITILAMREAWKMHMLEPNNKQYTIMTEHLGSALRNEHETSPSDFFTATKAKAYLATKSKKETGDQLEDKKEEEKADDENADETKKTETKSSKYTKIKKEKAAQTEPADDSPYWKFAFTDYVEDAKFKDLFKEDEEETTSSKSKKKKDDGYHIGAKELVVVDPIYLSIDERNDNPVEFVAAEEARSDLKYKVETCADALDMDVHYLDRYQVDIKDVEQFNDMAILRRWINEKMSHLDNDVYMYTSTSPELAELAKKYGTDYFAWMGIVTFVEPEQNIGTKLLLCIYWPIAPLLIYDMVTPDKSTFYFTLVANAETGKFEMQYYNANEMKDTDAAQTSNIYYILDQIKQK